MYRHVYRHCGITQELELAQHQIAALASAADDDTLRDALEEEERRITELQAMRDDATKAHTHDAQMHTHLHTCAHA